MRVRETVLTSFCPTAQFKSAGLSEFNNRWSVVHDFDRGAGEENWSLMHDDNPVMIAFPTEGEFAEVGVTFAHENSVVPLTVGLKQKPEGEVSLLSTCPYTTMYIVYVNIVTVLASN